VTTGLLLEGIAAGRVPADSLVCIVGGSEWQALGDIARFASAVSGVRSLAPSEPPTIQSRSRKLLELEERTIVDGIPLWPAEPVSEVEPVTSTLRQHIAGFDDPEEHTIVDAPFRPSDPPE
jgi:hypothetical protein